MLPGGAEAAIRAQSKLLGKYRKWHTARMKERRAGPYGVEFGRILDTIKHDMTPPEAGTFVRSFEASPLREAPLDVRQDAAIWLANGFKRMRIRQGLPAFDDPIALLDERPNVFTRILDAIMPNESSAEESPALPAATTESTPSPTPKSVDIGGDLEIPDFLKIPQADRAKAWGPR
jgi:hypothetical protein